MLQVGSLVWAKITSVNGPPKERPCVVTRIGVGTIEVVYGQDTKWAGATSDVPVLKDSLFGKLFPLKKETHFCDAQTIPLSDVTTVCQDRRNRSSPPYPEALCPPSSISKIEGIAIDARVRLAGSTGRPITTPRPLPRVSRRRSQAPTTPTSAVPAVVAEVLTIPTVLAPSPRANRRRVSAAAPHAVRARWGLRQPACRGRFLGSRPSYLATRGFWAKPVAYQDRAEASRDLGRRLVHVIAADVGHLRVDGFRAIMVVGALRDCQLVFPQPVCARCLDLRPGRERCEALQAKIDADGNVRCLRQLVGAIDLEADPPVTARILDEAAALHTGRGQWPALGAEEAIGVAEVGDAARGHLARLRLEGDPAQRAVGAPALAEARTFAVPIARPDELFADASDRLRMQTE